mmetsp:Transcript_25145/g.38922  ORF Transcript_25145/g.38922 Transcript_25145/m.38922 type:complete len:107 (+) Transcript_25145:149-469(+)
MASATKLHRCLTTGPFIHTSSPQCVLSARQHTTNNFQPLQIDHDAKIHEACYGRRTWVVVFTIHTVFSSETVKLLLLLVYISKGSKKREYNEETKGKGQKALLRYQ